MADLPHDVLSERVQEHIAGSRLLCAVFATFQFDPGFFEQEILPVLFDLPLSHVPEIRLIQLEDALRSVPGGIAVYYDHRGLVPEAGRARLDYRRIAIRHRSGYFHAKNVFALVESPDAEDGQRKERRLVVASLSANLTQSGWWENVEACHLEEIREHDATRMRGSLRSFLRRLENLAGDKAAGMHGAVEQVLGFLRGTGERRQRSHGGVRHTHFYDGKGTVPDFLEKAGGAELRDLNLEVLSPYVDGSRESEPLRDLIKRFRPREVRVLVPRDEQGDAVCPREMHSWLSELDTVKAAWGRMPPEMLARGRGTQVSERRVHAKVYRFFQASPRRELIFVGSANLTQAAHQEGGNVETGMLVDARPTRKPDWWLQLDTRRPSFAEDRAGPTEGAAPTGTPLSIRYWWNTDRAEAYWDDSEASPALAVSALGVPLFTVDPLQPASWRELSVESATALRERLPSTSLFTVTGHGLKPAVLLVQEEGMSHRPSLLFELSAADILRYWSLLTAEQRAAFLDRRGTLRTPAAGGEGLVLPWVRYEQVDSIFDRFAGIFHGFGCLERHVREALGDKRESEAVYRLLGRKYDSLGSLIDRVLTDAGLGRRDGEWVVEGASRRDDDSVGTDVDSYVTLLCAQQLVTELRRDYREFWARHKDDVGDLQRRLSAIASLRRTISERGPSEMPEFLDWFEELFLRRAAKLEPVAP